MKDALKDIIKDWLESFDTNIVAANDALVDNWFAASTPWNTLITLVKGPIETMALTIITIIFLLDFLKLTIHMDVLKWEFLLKCFFKFVFAKVCIQLSTYLLDAIWTTSISWIHRISTAGSSVGDSMWTALEPKLNGMGMLALLGFFISTGIMFMVMWIISIMIQVMAYARKFELVMYTAISPLPCAFLPAEDGGNRIAKKFFLTFAATCLQGVFMMMCLKLYGILVDDLVIHELTAASPKITTCVGQLLLCTIVLVMALTKCGSWAKSIFDVG